MLRISIVAIVVLLIQASPGTATAGGDPEAGHEMVERLCAGCHAIGASDESNHPAAPPFRTFADRWPLEHLEEAFAEGIVVGHHEIPMPEFVLEPEEIADLIAYLEEVGRQ